MEVKSYKSFNNLDLLSKGNGLERLFNMSESSVKALEEEWKEVLTYNLSIENELKVLLENELKEIVSVLDGKGIKVYQLKKINRQLVTRYVNWFEKNIVSELKLKYPVLKNRELPKSYVTKFSIKGKELTIVEKPRTLLETYTDMHKAYEKLVINENKLSKEFVKYTNYMKEHKLEFLFNNEDIEKINLNDLKRRINEHMGDKYLNEHYKDGDEVDLDHECDYCNTYIVGENRCDCGNRRIYIEVEGDVFDGFYCYPVAY